MSLACPNYTTRELLAQSALRFISLFTVRRCRYLFSKWIGSNLARPIHRAHYCSLNSYRVGLLGCNRWVGAEGPLSPRAELLAA